MTCHFVFRKGEWDNFHIRKAALYGLRNIALMGGRGLDYEVHLNWISDGAQNCIFFLA